jgi:exopolysaccharide biosynthesis polyprenyl glycosylphosphotransferase
VISSPPNKAVDAITMTEIVEGSAPGSTGPDAVTTPRAPAGRLGVVGRRAGPHSTLGTADGGTAFSVGRLPSWEWSTDGSATIPVGRHRRTDLRDARVRRSLAVADVVACYVALLAATRFVGISSPSLRASAVLIAPLIIVANKAIGLYDRDEHILRKTTLDELPSILHFSVLYALAIWLSQVVMLTGSLTRPQVFALALTTFVLMTCGRMVARCAAIGLSPEERCVVVGNAADADRVATKLAASPGLKAAVVARITFDSDVNEVSDFASIATLVRTITDQDAERVIVATGGHDQEEILQVIRTLKALGVKVSVLPRLLEVVGSSSTFDEIDGITLLGVRQSGLSKSSSILKRAMDLSVAGVALLILSPLFLIIVIAIKVDSRGPVFFRQSRIGRGGRRFSIYKFRSMIADAEVAKDSLLRQNQVEGGLFKIADDPRITRVGRVLRPLSLDELPQLLNVLVGHMSLVGPRPLVPDEDALIEGWERRRLEVRPGMTGMWQIFGSSRIPLPEMVKIDYFYYANWSIWSDVKILLRTIPYMVRHRGM